MTYLELVNSVLKRMRETTVSSVTENALSTLVGEFVNDAKRVVEDAWQWTNLVDYVDITTVDGTSTYALNALTPGISGGYLRQRARLYLDQKTGDPVAVITTSGREAQLSPANLFAAQMEVSIAGNQSQEGQPRYFAIEPAGTTTDGYSNKRIRLYPTPDAVYNIRVFFVNPQNPLSSDSTALVVPDAPVIQQAYLYSLYERGEEVGEMLTLTSAKADQALSDAIAHDQQATGLELGFYIPNRDIVNA